MTMQKAICPNCETNFDVNKHRRYKGIKQDFIDQLQKAHIPPEKWVDESSLVNCPKCKKIFISEGIRFFGILSPKGLKVVIGLFVAGFIIVAFYQILAQ